MENAANISLKARLSAVLLRIVMGALGWTYRVQRFEGEESWKAMLEDGSPVVIAAWHNRIFYLALMIKSLLAKGFRLAMMSSLSKDGEIGAAMGLSSGARVVRGSSSRGGAGGLRRFYQLMAKESYSIIILPDGSKGPKYEAKLGAIVIAQLSRAPIMPISYSADRCWRIGSWDRMMIPKPFARIAIVVGNPIKVGRELDKEGLESSRLELENSLNALNEQSAAVFKNN